MKLQPIFSRMSVVRRSLVAGLLMVAPLTALAAATPEQQRNFSVSAKTDVPGQTLSPGIYSIEVLDHLSDRTVVRIRNTSGGSPVIFLAVTSRSLPGSPAEAGPVLWAQTEQGRKAMRGFRFPNGRALEFVFPKATAVAIAKANSDHVIAIDPASEGRKESNLTDEDRQMVNLWLLTPVKVGPESGIQAQKYQQVAEAEPGPVLTGGATNQATGQTAAATTPAPVRPRPRPVIKKLPHTAGPVPLFLMVGLMAFAAASVLRMRREW